MTPAVLTLTGLALLATLAIGLIGGSAVLRRWRLLGLFLLVFLTDNLLIVLTNRYPAWQLIPNATWGASLTCSWSGKLYSILFAIAVAAVLRSQLARRDMGLTLRQRPGSLLPSLLVIAGIAAWATMVGVASSQGPWDPMTLVYLATMPSLNEELVYRGLLPAILDRVLPNTRSVLGAPMGWGLVIASLLFGALHGLWLDEGFSVQVDWIAWRNATISGLLFAWLRARTGSLLLPVVAHSLENLLFFLPRMI